jgi:predicted ArsR family transcriptional regulator
VWLALKYHGPATAAKVEQLLAAAVSPESVRGSLLSLREAGLVEYARKLGKTPRGRWAKMWQIAETQKGGDVSSNASAQKGG